LAGAPPQTTLWELTVLSQTPSWNKGDLLLKEKVQGGKRRRRE